jgi:hypothetical protein
VHECRKKPTVSGKTIINFMVIICLFYKECQEISQNGKNNKRIVQRNGIQEVRGSTPLSSTKGKSRG